MIKLINDIEEALLGLNSGEQQAKAINQLFEPGEKHTKYIEDKPEEKRPTSAPALPAEKREDVRADPWWSSGVVPMFCTQWAVE